MGLRIGELRLNVGGLVVSGFDDKTMKKCGSGGDENKNLTKFERISPGRVCFFLSQERKRGIGGYLRTFDSTCLRQRLVYFQVNCA